jgi:hypothetical protein
VVSGGRSNRVCCTEVDCLAQLDTNSGRFLELYGIIFLARVPRWLENRTFADWDCVRALDLFQHRTCDVPVRGVSSVAHPGDPSFACAPAWCGSPPRRQSTTQTPTRRTTVQTSARARSLPSLNARLLPSPPVRDKTSPRPRDAPAAALAVKRGAPFLFTSGDSDGFDGKEGKMNGVTFRYFSYSVRNYRRILGDHGFALVGVHADIGNNTYYLAQKLHRRVDGWEIANKSTPGLYWLPDVIMSTEGSCVEYCACGLPLQIHKIRRCKMNSVISEIAKISHPEKR